MLLENNHHYVSTEGKTTQQIVDMRFKEYEIRKAKEAEDLAAFKAQLAQNKADMTAPVQKDEPKANTELATVPHPSAIGRALAKFRHTLHI